MYAPTLVFFKWDDVYNSLGIKDFIYFISSPSIQETLFPAKVVFIFFTVFFFCAVIYFYINSSYIHYHFLQSFTDFISLQSFGVREINKRWKKIIKKTESGKESEYKLAIIEADDFLRQILEEKGTEEETFEELVNISKKIIPNFEDILSAHSIRNSIVYDSDYGLDLEKAKKILSYYENAIKNISVS